MQKLLLWQLALVDWELFIHSLLPISPFYERINIKFVFTCGWLLRVFFYGVNIADVSNCLFDCSNYLLRPGPLINLTYSLFKFSHASGF